MTFAHSITVYANTHESFTMAEEKTPLERMRSLALTFNEEMPSDVMLKGDGTIWVVSHQDLKPRKMTQYDVLKLLHTAIQRSGQLISI